MVEVVGVIVRQDDQVQRGQIGDLTVRLHLAPGVDAVAEVEMVTLVQERGVGQDREPRETDQRRGVADEVHLTRVEVGLLPLRERECRIHRRPPVSEERMRPGEDGPGCSLFPA